MAEVPEQIIHEATRLFAAHGFDGASLQAIADAVGIRKPSLLYHFPSKDALRRGVLERMLSHWNEALPRLLMAATSGEEQFDAVVSEVVKFFTADPDRARLLVREVLDRPAEMGELIESYVRPWVALVCNYIRKGQGQGRIYPDVDPEAYCVQFINLVVSSVATYDCMGAMAPSTGVREELLGRHIKELLRVAKASLFTDESIEE